MDVAINHAVHVAALNIEVILTMITSLYAATLAALLIAIAGEYSDGITIPSQGLKVSDTHLLLKHSPAVLVCLYLVFIMATRLSFRLTSTIWLRVSPPL